MATVHLMYGLAGAGKSTYAQRLQAERPALRFTLDEWMIRLYPGLSIEDKDYGTKADGVRGLIWDVAEQALLRGVDVVLDWNFWSVERRQWAVRQARDVPAEVELHWVEIGPQEATDRASRRARHGHGHFHTITAAGNTHLAALMEPPSEAEGLRITRV